MSQSVTEPYPARLPVRSQAWRLGVVWLAGGLFWLVIFGMAIMPQGTVGALGLWDALLALDVLAGQIAVLLVGFRRRWPVLVAILATALSTVSVWAFPAALLAVMSLATRRRLVPLVVVGVLTALAGVVYEVWIAPVLLDPALYPRIGANLLVSVSIVSLLGLLFFVIVALIGWNVGSRRELIATWRRQAQTARSEQAARVAQGQLAERARIAREMHDVLAHRLSLVAMHAGALAYREDLSEPERREAAEIVRSGAQHALEELREVLGVLRADHPGTEGGVVEAPQPGLSDIPALIAEVTSNGQQVSLQADPELWPRSVSLPAPTGRHAYRVVQEALTNARKHAPGAAVTVTMTGKPGAGLDLAVANPATPQSDDPPGPGGRGLTGIAERVQLAGGTVEAGLQADQFVVRAGLPWPQAEETGDD